ncbi:MAG: hypothetical protein GXC72_13420 [Chitinophagaceae bacterium]|nr:hypothetical protein [Chitinophagaceae bacterium]
MKISLFPVYLFVLCLFACSGKQKTPGNNTSTTDTTKFYPISDFIRSQVDYLIQMKKPVTLVRIRNGVKDSAQIDYPQLQLLADGFLTKDIAGDGVKQGYRESVFQDGDTHSITLSYSTSNTQLPVQGVDVLLDENTRLVKRIFIRAQQNKNDTLTIEQYSWNAFKGFQINRYITYGKDYRMEERNSISWPDSLSIQRKKP